VYVGSGTLLLASSGRVNGTCHAKIVDGEPVDSQLRTSITADSPFGLLPCDVVVAPSGSAMFTCHRD
jgi:hypothetical protein